jgi:hypothetical protein
MLTGYAMYGMGGGRSAAAERNDPNREKTPEDLARIAAAQRKRERKAKRRSVTQSAPQNPIDSQPHPMIPNTHARKT